MILRPQLYGKKNHKKLELRLYVCGSRVKSLAEPRPSCFGLINELKKNKVNCSCRCDLRVFCKKVSVQFKDTFKEETH